MIIGISGKLNSGKDTVAQIINFLSIDGFNSYDNFEDFSEFYTDGIDEYPFKTVKFADKLKDCACLILGCTREQIENREFKEKELGKEWWYYKGRNGSLIPFNDDSKRNSEDLIKLTPRLLLQLLGTDCGRNIIHPNLWVLTLMQDYKGDTEIWKPIENYENFYEISSFGRVRSLDRKIIYGEERGEYHSRKGQILKPTLSGGYETVSLSNKTFTVHSLVAKHFVEGYQEGFVVNHIDYNKTNNFHKNLEWITQAENIQHNKTTIRGNFGEKQKGAKLTDEKVVAIKKLLEDGTFNQKQISDLFEVSPTTISDIKKGKKWNHVGKDIPVISPIIPIEYPNWIIPDVRFKNEADVIKEKDGLLIRVNRPCTTCNKYVNQFCSNPYHVSNHQSEIDLDDYGKFDYVINNDGTVDELILKTKDILIKEHII